MRAVVQRSRGGSVSVDGQVLGGFDGPGLVVLVGVTHDDSASRAARLADKVYDLRLFDASHASGRELPEGSPRELSASDLGLPILVISQFTLYGDTRKGRRPTWDAAAPRPIAEPLVDAVVERLRDRGADVSTGEFGADMLVTLTNDGPITMILDVSD
jgi:D-tyrosyl-tRNA(Tyr) deacylase